jgi:hypothetical protein
VAGRLSAARPRRAAAQPPPVAGCSGTPLARKLGIAAGMRVRAQNPPPHYRSLLAPLPAGVSFVRRADATTGLVHLFETRRARLARALPALRRQLASSAALWVSWPKKSAGIATDITEDAVRELALPLGFVDIKVCAVDAVWSALKLVVRRELR